jgi:hypothetical protein
MTDAMNGVCFRVTWSPVKGRPSWNFPALRSAAAAAGLDLQSFETVGEPTDRLVVTPITDEGGAAKPKHNQM